jgi:hypothetical protein
MEEVTLVFEPSEMEIIETFEFEEDVQRPEELRFFTLDEQLIDYFEQMLPKKNRVTRAEYKKIEKEVSRLRELYDKIIVLTESDYRINSARRPVSVSWLKPIYGGFDYESYPYAQRINPLHVDGARRTANAYPVLLASLPRPYRSEGTDGIPITQRTELVNEDGTENIIALGNYVKSRRELRDDGTVRILSVPINNTGDDIRRTGFFIEDRPLEMPHPLADHPFLSSSKASKLLTTEPLLDVFPSIEAIVAHAVPVTTDPYGEGDKYLKVYDVKLSEVPWKSWKERFPPADTIKSENPLLSIVFPMSEDIVAPSERLQKVYESKWPKSVYPRQWLMRQEDGGGLVTKMLLSDAGDFGLIAPDMMHERPAIQLPDSTPVDCLKTDTFEEFLASGVYRNPGVCAPTAFVTQERQELINKGRKAWTETTNTNIQKEYIALFKYHLPPGEKLDETKYEEFKPRETSELHNNVRIILRDDTLLPPDKSYNIRLLIKEITPVKNLFLDVNGVEIICAHTLAQLDGELEADRFAFYNKWTALVEGSRVCTSCGEEVNNDSYVAQQQYDDNGRLVMNYDVLSNTTIQAPHSSFASSLTQLKTVFSLDNAGESVMYILLNGLQILPDENQLIPILGYVRKGSLTAKKLTGTAKNEFEGLLGITAMVTLLQTHNPFLIPRRSFGNKIVKLSGFPRDTDDETTTPVLNLLLTILTELTEAYPTTFKEPIATIMREVTRNRKKIREKCIKFIRHAHSEFRVQFETAKQRALTVVDTVEVNNIVLSTLVPKKVEFVPGEARGQETFAECMLPKPRSVISAKLLPSLVQKTPEFWKTKPSNSAQYIPPIEIKMKYTFPEKKEIEKGVGIGFSKTLKLELIRRFADSNTDGVALLSLLSRLLDILSPLKFPAETIIEYRKFVTSINAFEKPSLFRDAVKGRIYQLIDSIKSDGQIEAIRTAMTRDLDMNMILLTKEEAEKQVNQLRARERETFKKRMRELTDDAREVTKMLIDIGISQYIITNEDRKLFAREAKLPTTIDDDEKDTDNTPEEGFTRRDYVDGEEQLNADALPIDPDRGDYGDVRDRPGDDYSHDTGFDEDVY